MEPGTQSDVEAAGPVSLAAWQQAAGNAGNTQLAAASSPPTSARRNLTQPMATTREAVLDRARGTCIRMCGDGEGEGDSAFDFDSMAFERHRNFDSICPPPMPRRRTSVGAPLGGDAEVWSSLLRGTSSLLPTPSTDLDVDSGLMVNSLSCSVPVSAASTHVVLAVTTDGHYAAVTAAAAAATSSLPAPVRGRYSSALPLHNLDTAHTLSHISGSELYLPDVCSGPFAPMLSTAVTSSSDGNGGGGAYVGGDGSGNGGGSGAPAVTAARVDACSSHRGCCTGFASPPVYSGAGGSGEGGHRSVAELVAAQWTGRMFARVPDSGGAAAAAAFDGSAGVHAGSSLPFPTHSPRATAAAGGLWPMSYSMRRTTASSLPPVVEADVEGDSRGLPYLAAAPRATDTSASPAPPLGVAATAASGAEGLAAPPAAASSLAVMAMEEQRRSVATPRRRPQSTTIQLPPYGRASEGAQLYGEQAAAVSRTMLRHSSGDGTTPRGGNSAGGTANGYFFRGTSFGWNFSAFLDRVLDRPSRSGMSQEHDRCVTTFPIVAPAEPTTVPVLGAAAAAAAVESGDVAVRECKPLLTLRQELQQRQHAQEQVGGKASLTAAVKRQQQPAHGRIVWCACFGGFC